MAKSPTPHEAPRRPLCSHEGTHACSWASGGQVAFLSGSFNWDYLFEGQLLLDPRAWFPVYERGCLSKLLTEKLGFQIVNPGVRVYKSQLVLKPSLPPVDCNDRETHEDALKLRTSLLHNYGKAFAAVEAVEIICSLAF